MKRIQSIENTVYRSRWLAFLCYALIAFEFFYMISPFAVYLYSVYRPALRFFEQVPGFAWLNQTFLPHVVMNTRSFIFDHITEIGLIIGVMGFLFFCIGAVQVYWAKIRKSGVVTGGIYRFIRHPQYSALIISGFGLLLVWPRFVALIAYVTMCFVYHFLAWVEERECLGKFGEKYESYLKLTGRFFPKIYSKQTSPSGGLKLSTLALFYPIVLAVSLLCAISLRNWSIQNLYTVSGDHSITISVVELKEKQMKTLLETVMRHKEVQKVLRCLPDSANTINYIMPDNWYASEIPMHPGDAVGDHFRSENAAEIKRLRIVVTHAIRVGQSMESGRRILVSGVQRIPLIEIVFNAVTGEVIETSEPLRGSLAETTPMPLF